MPIAPAHRAAALLAMSVCAVACPKPSTQSNADDAGVATVDASVRTDAGSATDSGGQADAARSPDAAVLADAGASTDAGGPADGGSTADPCMGLITDKANHAMTTLAKPAVGQTVMDPQFGTTIRRITDVANSGGGQVLKPVYATVSAWNADESLLILYRTEGISSRHELYDGHTYQFIRALDEIDPADLEQIYWHTSDPDVLFYADRTDRTFVRDTVSTGQTQVLHTFSFCADDLHGGSDPMFTSWDSRMIGLRCGNQIFSYDIAQDTVGARVTLADSNAPQAAPSGERFFMNQGGGVGTVRDRDMVVLRTLDLDSADEHATLGALGNGHDALVAVAFDDGPMGSGTGSVVLHDMVNGSSRVIVGPSTGYPYPPGGTHLSAMGFGAPGWVAVSVVGDHDGNSVLDNEVVLVDINAGGRVCRVAHHRSWGGDGPQGYWAEPHVVLSPSATRVLFGSDWGGGNTVDTYVVELPAYP